MNIYEKNTNSKNGVTSAEKTDISLLNADKNNKTTRKNYQSTRSQTNLFINTFKKIKFYQKNITVLIVLENQFETVQNIQEINHLLNLITEAGH